MHNYCKPIKRMPAQAQKCIALGISDPSISRPFSFLDTSMNVPPKGSLASTLRMELAPVISATDTLPSENPTIFTFVRAKTCRLDTDWDLSELRASTPDFTDQVEAGLRPASEFPKGGLLTSTIADYNDV